MNKLDNILSTFSWITAFVVVVGLIIVIVGAIKVITGDLGYEEWVNDLWKFAAAAGVTAVGRGIHKSGVVHRVHK